MRFADSRVTIMAAWDITWKDLRLLANDRRALVLLLLLPLMFIAIIGMAAGQFLTKDDEQRKLKIAVVDEEKSEPTRELVKALSQHDGIRILEKDTVQAATEALDKDEATVMLIIPIGYDAKVETLSMGDVIDSANGQLKDGPDALGLKFEFRSAIGDGGVVKWLVFSDALRTISRFVAMKNAIARRWIINNEPPEDELVDPNAENAGDNEVAVAAPETDVLVEDTSQKVFLILVPGFTVMFVFFLINIMARSFIAERDQGTLRRLKLAPVDSASILIGKTLPFYLTSVLQTAMLFLCGRFLFNMSWGPEPIYLVPVILCTSLAATSLGLLLATIVRTDQQVSSYGTSLVLVFGGISGCLFPRVWLPAMMKKVSLFTPHAWSLEAFDAVLTHSNVDQMLVFDCCLALLSFAAAFFVCGWWRFRVAG
jgi:ABC-2 type transport system permease protein